MSEDLEPQREEQTDIVDDPGDDHQRASEKARAKRDADREDADREPGQLDLDTAGATKRLESFEAEGEDA